MEIPEKKPSAYERNVVIIAIKVAIKKRNRILFSQRI